MRVRATLVGATLVAGSVVGGAGTAVAVGASGATADASAASPAAACVKTYTTPYKSGNQVLVAGFWTCWPPSPQDGLPLPVSLQRQLSNGTWQTIASGSGTAAYTCQSTVTRTYRSLQKPTPTVALPCS